MATKTAKGVVVKKSSVKSKKGISKKTAQKAFRSDSKQTASLIKVGKVSALNAIRESKALDLTITYMENGVLYKENAEGKRVELKKASKKLPTTKSLVLKKGMIFYAKK